jgi:hypothetical protein
LFNVIETQGSWKAFSIIWPVVDFFEGVLTLVRNSKETVTKVNLLGRHGRMLLTTMNTVIGCLVYKVLALGY